MSIQLGVIADDFTGATDIAGFMVQSGWKVVQLLNEPDENTVIPKDVDAIVVSLKSRSCPVDEAISASLNTCQWLKNQAGCHQIFFKYCSTFDSTEKGNIGPVTDALMKALKAEITVVTPALPVNGRTVIHGHLFVNGKLLNESGMQDHPVTPMADANLLRVMEKQSQGQAGLVDLVTVLQGADAIKSQLTTLQNQGVRYAITDAITMENLLPIAQAAKDLPLLTGGSGLGAAIATVQTGIAWQRDTALGEKPAATQRKAVILSGSCSQMTNAQVNTYTAIAPSHQVDVGECLSNPDYAKTLSAWVVKHQSNPLAPMLYATLPADKLKQVQQQYGMQQSSESVEKLFGEVVSLLKQQGFNTFIIAGGETSGKVVQSLGTQQLSIGAPIVPGVPWVKDRLSGDWLALKSGNFGQENFFQEAQEMYL